ncbi:hypothetical protein OU5_1326 [Pseudomonas mandelii JR-1]|uniref:Uncharacterized protein n=1 Tax=Pseudomonas mandelii JR-1 TaxID=1147786 RepID=A0A024E755_9PSED|nr:hypothetical protein OU5_1326 [Pseudomonas mandelii JR-1]
MAVHPSPLVLADPALSQASSLPQGAEISPWISEKLPVNRKKSVE